MDKIILKYLRAAATPEIPGGGSSNSYDEGWEFFIGIMNREDSESILRDRIPGSFLIRRSPVNYNIRIVVLRDDNSFSHIPLKVVHNKYRVATLMSTARSRGGGVEFDTLSETLDALGLHSSDGIVIVKRMAK